MRPAGWRNWWIEVRVLELLLPLVVIGLLAFGALSWFINWKTLPSDEVRPFTIRTQRVAVFFLLGYCIAMFAIDLGRAMARGLGPVDLSIYPMLFGLVFALVRWVLDRDMKAPVQMPPTAVSKEHVDD